MFEGCVKRWLTYIEPYVVCNMQYGNRQYAPGIDFGDEGRYKRALQVRCDVRCHFQSDKPKFGNVACVTARAACSGQ
jgi:hypothetical protein